MARPHERRTSQFKLPQGQPQPSVPSLENNFVGGLKTEFTGLNFPENACTSTSNCTFSRTGSTMRRSGMDYESNFATFATSIANSAISTFMWTNAGGDGNTVVFVAQIGGTLYFYQASNATLSTSVSSTKLASTVSLSSFIAAGGSLDPTIECQYSAGNGYLFVFHPNSEPFYCTFSAGVIAAFQITIQTRDFTGVTPEPGNPLDVFRPTSLNAEHQYNLQNQGWTSAAPWAANSTTVAATQTGSTVSLPLGLITFTVQAGLTTPTAGQGVSVSGTIASIGSITAAGIVNSYSGTSLAINVSSSSSFNVGGPSTLTPQNWIISPTVAGGQINIWHSAIGNYPSNADVWWTFKNSSGVFDPTTTVANITLSTPAPKGSYILQSFNQLRSAVSGVAGITNVSTTVRPKTGAWFQGRVWYAGVDASFAASGDEPFFTWTENVYFSQIVTDTSDFGRCYQTNDPTSETLSTVLPTDGGIIQIQGCGSIYKLFPVLNGIIVFASNGTWFITGNTGIGFSAIDFTVSKISGEHSISGSSFVDVNGYPMFWNQDGIYMIAPGQSYTSGQSALQVKNLTLTTIKQFYQSIPTSSKLYARGSYNHITGVIQWLYKSTLETNVTSRYQFDSILNFLTYTEAFYNWTIAPGSTVIGLNYMEFTGSTPSTAPSPTFKYFTNTNLNTLTFSEERDNVNWKDWTSSGIPRDYNSVFITGYRLKGQGQRKFQPQYIYMFSEIPTYGYIFNGIWDYAISNLSNRFSTRQVINVNQPGGYFSKAFKKLRVRGNGYVFQMEISSLTGKPFNIAGWSILDTIGIA